MTDVLAGEYLSVFKGSGIEFEKVREYWTGDDVRSIDWNVTARMNAPFVKEFREEREQTLMLLVDVSASLRFGSQALFKNELSAELVAILAFLAVKNKDKVGCILFSDQVELYLPPQKGKAYIWSILRSILTFEAKSHKTDIRCALEALLRYTKRRSLCFVISDFIAEGYEQSLAHVAKKHDLICVEVSDPLEHELGGLGFLELEDAETEECITVDTKSHSWQKAFALLQQERELNLRTQFARYGADFFPVLTNESPISALEKFLKQRERRKKRKIRRGA